MPVGISLEETAICIVDDAGSLLASRWPVDEAVAPGLTVRTAELERHGVGRAEAFQRAVRAIIDDKSADAGKESRAHPYYWAPFVLLGSGGSAQ